MSRARAKGTRGENFFLAHLQPIWPWVDRAPLKGVNDHGDFLNVPWLHEAKHTAVPRFLEWARVAARKAGHHRWVVLWKGDMRQELGQPVVVLSLPFYLELAQCWQDHNHWVPAVPVSGEVA